ncbi:hypothetical protein [Morganella morganii]|uniref:hypothetical protein n=1 Tax=Morganella morganii TaxID=582 RepID=UPI0021A34A41|nr:hypothetical protein [Morganella morganii]
MSQSLDFDKALKALQFGRTLTGKDDVLTESPFTELEYQQYTDIFLYININTIMKNNR